MQNRINSILDEMESYLSISQMKQLQKVLVKCLEEKKDEFDYVCNHDYLDMFLTAKRIEGCSERTIAYYKATISNMIFSINVPIRKITTEIIREYLMRYYEGGKCGKVTIDNIRRNLSNHSSN